MRKVLFQRLIPLVLISLIFSNAFAQEDFSYEPAQIIFTIPAGWYYEIDGEMMTVQPSTGEMALVFIMIKTDDLDIAIEAASAELSKQYSDIEIVDEVEGTVNGLASYYFNANAKLLDGGEDVFIRCELVDTPGDFVMFIHGAANHTTLERFTDDVELILDSIRPM